MNPNIPSSYLEIIIGPMFSGKTSKLVEIYKQCKFCNIEVLVINHGLDKRYHESLMSTHDKTMIECVQVTVLDETWSNINILEKYQISQVILINEGQFFEDLYTSVVKMIKENKKIYIVGLDGDFECKKFGQVLDLIPLSDKVSKISSLCSLCKNGTPGIFSKRITPEKEQTVIGSENYVPVCRNCYKL
jgi:thymidine kinase